MNTSLADPTIGNEATTLPEDSTLTLGVVSSTPSKNIDSATFLQQQCFTGLQVSVPLPFGAAHGFEAMFAVRVDPLIRLPMIYQQSSVMSDFYKSTGDTNYVSSLSKLDRSRLPIRPYNKCLVAITGPEPPQSIFARSYRYNRCDIVYTLRIVSTYTGGGILMVVPVKGIPRGAPPLNSNKVAQIVANGMQVNSNLQCDLSKSRQIRFVYPYEYPTEFQDVSEDYVTSENYNYASAPSGPRSLDNWFVVGTRGSIITPTNADSFTIYIDYAFGSHQLITPLLPNIRMVYPTVTMLTDGDKTYSCILNEGDFDDATGLIGNITLTFSKEVNVAGKSSNASWDGISKKSGTVTVVQGDTTSIYLSAGDVTSADIPKYHRRGMLLVACASGITCTLGGSSYQISSSINDLTVFFPSNDPYMFTVTP